MKTTRRFAIRSLVMSLAMLGGRLGAADPLPWPEVPAQQLREDVFGVRFRQMREMDGNKAALAFLQQRFAKDPQPWVKAYMAWIMIFSAGWGYPELKDEERGLRLAEEAMREGSVVARDVFARAKAYGIGGRMEPAEVVRLLQEASDLGSTRSMARLAICYALGYGVPKNLARAEQLARRAAQLGQPDGLHELAAAYETGKIYGAPHLDRALSYYDEACAHRSGDAWRRLEELEKTLPRAKFYRALAFVREGNLAAWLAPTRVKEHVRTLEAMTSYDARALVELGIAHIDGEFAPRDYARARTYLEQAVTLGSRDASFWLAKMRLRGFGQKAEPKEALAEIERIADEGVAVAMYYFGYLCDRGAKEAPGIQKNAERAFRYIRGAAERGHPYAIVDLGFCYEHGIGTPENRELAAKVYWQAFLRGFPDGRNRVRRLMAFVKEG